MLKTSHKLIIIITFALLAIFFVGFLFFQFTKGSAKLSQVADHKAVIKPSIETPVDPIKLESDYKTKSNEILSEYLRDADENNQNLATTTEQAQSALLNLSLPPQYKERHLAEVLLLGEIAELAKSGNTVAVERKIKELRDFFEKK
jgi:hypothetical protein